MFGSSALRGSRSVRCAVSTLLAVTLAVSPLAGCRTAKDSREVTQDAVESVVMVEPWVPGGATTAIAGTVMHEGVPLPGAMITLASPAMLGTRVAVSDENGEYAFRAVPPGPYTLRFEMEGMSTLTRVAEVHAGYLTRVPATIQLSGIAEAITVTSVAPSALDTQAMTAHLPQRNNRPPSRQETSKRRAPKPPVPSTVLETTEVRTNYGVESLPVARATAQPSSLAPGSTLAGIDACRCEQYAHVEEGAFREAAKEPISTFSIDTDRASYANARRFIQFGMLPPVESVRVEEMINYFDYGYPEPSDGKPFSITTEIADCPWNATHKILRVGVQGKRIPSAALPPGNLVFLIDTSGSMGTPDKLALVQESLKRLVEQLREKDQVAIVVYAGSAGLVLPSTSGRDKFAILNAIDNLQSGGSTAGGAGILLAYQVAADNYLRDGNNRVILATDGDFNVGLSTPRELEQLIEAKRKEGVFLSVLGVGTGNLNDTGMETLADKGNGQYSYLDGLDEAEKVLVREMAGTLLTIAKDVKIQVEFNPARVGAYRLVGYDNRILDRKEFDDDTKDAGELGAGHSVTALYELVPPGGEREAGATDHAREEVPADERSQFQGSTLARVRLRYKEPKAEVSGLVESLVADGNNSIFAASDDFRFVAAVAQFGLLLRESKHRGTASWKSVNELASSASALDSTADRTNFIALAKKAEELEMQKMVSTN